MQIAYVTVTLYVGSENVLFLFSRCLVIRIKFGGANLGIRKLSYNGCSEHKSYLLKGENKTLPKLFMLLFRFA